MTYPAELHESIAKVEASRPKRLPVSFPRLSPEEREDILRLYHPDYIQDAFRPLRLGPNQKNRIYIITVVDRQTRCF